FFFFSSRRRHTRFDCDWSSDVCSSDLFTGSADTAARVRSHTTVLRRSVRVNIEADSINSAILGPDCAPASDLFDLLVKEVLKERSEERRVGKECRARWWTCE